MALNPKLAGEFIVKNAKYLTVNEEGVDNLVSQIILGIQNKTIDIENFSQHDFHPKSSDTNASNWIFLIDTLNFCFWTPGHDATKWNVDGQTGYFGLCAAISRAIKEDKIDFTNPSYYSKITVEQLSYILRSDDGFTMCPMIPERVNCLHQVGHKLIEKYGGNFENCVKISENSAEKLLQLIVEEFECFKDEAEYNGQRVQILKRAQILVGDIWACFRGEGLGKFNDLDKITMFADYRVPQVLVHFGSIEYSDELLAALKADEILQNGDEREVEIRGASIHVVELVKEKALIEMAKNYPELSSKHVNSILIDHFLWDYRRKHAKILEHIPFHKTFSIYY